MRLILWILQTLIARSWLIVGGIALGLIARWLMPDTAEQTNANSIVIPQAKAAYEQLVEKEQQSREAQATKKQQESEQAELERIGDFEIIQ